ncbi:hypothetical protein [Cupriavidus plantarum]|uniref:hypothetical protein n=1 Tax=Cupriavidus plantarum TaxID=942865 RepID=UPI001AFF03A8|nr:hypothetical protein [Cupriavidus plantarum]CAG2145561.1 hypothetical protein LMG26296_03767 [Cupriavidus plantarum]SMR86742.1 hypothetical protein SAMN05421735_5581 [Cupriavidus plantarum]
MTTSARHIYDQPALAPLLTIYRTVAVNLLTRGESAGGRVSLPTTEALSYYIAERAGEVQVAIDFLAFAGDRMKETLSGTGEFRERDYQYHYENVLFRAVGTVDRLFLLAGTSAFMSRKELSSTRANENVKRCLKKNYLTGALAVLEEAESLVKPLKKGRNKVAHVAGYTDTLLIAASIDRTPEVDAIYRRELENYHRQGIETVTTLHAELAKLAEKLVVELALVFEFIVEEHNTPSRKRKKS